MDKKLKILAAYGGSLRRHFTKVFYPTPSVEVENSPCEMECRITTRFDSVHSELLLFIFAIAMVKPKDPQSQLKIKSHCTWGTVRAKKMITFCVRFQAFA